MEFDGQGVKIANMYRQDTVLVVIFIIFVWLVLGFVLISIIGLARNNLMRDVILVAGLMAGIFVTSALFAVIVHLKKNRVSIYSEELSQIKKQ